MFLRNLPETKLVQHKMLEHIKEHYIQKENTEMTVRMRKTARAIAFVMALILLIGVCPVTSKAENEKLTGKTAWEITQMMGKGWNLGNTFDATGGNKNDVYSQETSWGNPKVTKELIDGVKEAGFTTIRIPVTWYKHIDRSNGYKINDAFLDRVNQVVDYAFDNELFVILNLHHENWVNDKNIHENYKEIGKELSAVWNQLADRFAEYDQHLIFESMNEPRAVGKDYEWNGNQACYDAVNYLNQVFVDCIRGNGKGNNPERAIMIPGYAASSNPSVLKSIQIPQYNGKDAENVIISVHCYSPYNFCLSDNQDSFNPKNTQDTADITSLMSNLKSLFLSKGIPVVIGECGATNTRDNDEARKIWFTYFGDITSEYGIPAVVWDNGAKGNSGGECHNYFVRKTGEMAYPELLSAFIYGDLEAKKPHDLFIDFEPYKEGGATVLASPEQYGFFPKTLGKKSRVNHSKDANIGFSAAITAGGENSYATMDLSKYAGKTINVQFYLQADSNSAVTLGMIDKETYEIVTAQVDTNWTRVTFSYQFDEEQRERALFFKGDGAVDFYVDDISVTMVEEKDRYETQVLADAEEPEGTSGEASEDAAGETTEVTTEDKTDNENPSESQPQVSERADGQSSVVIWVVVIGIVMVAGLVIILLKKKGMFR